MEKIGCTFNGDCVSDGDVAIFPIYDIKLCLGRTFDGNAQSPCSSLPIVDVKLIWQVRH